MQVKQRLRINALVSTMAVLAILVVLLLAAYRVSKVLETTKIANAIVTTSFERLILRTDLHRTGSERSKTQLIAKHKQIGELLKAASAKFTASEDKKIVNELITNHESIGKISKTIRENREKRGPRTRPDAFSEEIEERQLSQLNMRVYETIFLASKLQESSTEAVISSLKLAGGGILLVLLVVSAVTLINSAMMNRTIAGRISRLRDGAVVIGGGELDHKIDITGNDEFAELADAFNEMTAKLRDSYHDLERDITGRKLAEEALRESEEKLSLALRSAAMGVWRLELDGQKRYFDDQVCLCLGIDAERFGGTAEEFFAAVHPDDRAAITVALDRTIGSGKPYETEYRAVWPDGSIHHIAARGRLARDAAGQPRWVDGLVWDITGRRQAEEALRESEERFRVAQELSPDGFTIFRPVRDNQGGIIDFTWVYENAAIARLNGTDPATVLGRRLLDIIPSHAETPFHKVYQQVAESGESVVLEAPFHGETMAEEKWFRVVVVPSGKDIAILAQDITKRKVAEEAIKASLHEKEVMLKEIHHRVKNNLQVISSLVSMQADGSGDETVREVLRDVTYRVRSMALVHEKLYHSESLARIDFAEYAQSLLGYLWRAHGAAAESVELSLDLEPVELPVDTAMPCGLILNELAGNALKHAFRGRIEGEVAVSLRGADGSISLSVRDNGVGLPPDLNWRHAESLGLRLVQMLAGQLQAAVEVDQCGGTEFLITFKLPEAAKDGERAHG